GVGEKPARRVQGLEDPGWRDRSRARVQARPRQGRHPCCHTVRRRAVAASLVLLLGLVSCGSQGSVAVSASIESPTVAVLQASALAAALSGGFNLRLELGAYAPSGTDVSPAQGNFSLVKPSDQSPLLVLHLRSTTPPPYHLEPGANSTAVFT